MSSGGIDERPRDAVALFPLIAGYAAANAGLMSSAIWIPVAAHRYATSQATLGLIASLQLLAAAVIAQFVAPRLQRTQPRDMILTGLCLLLAGALATLLLSPSLALFGAFRVIEGTGAGFCLAASGVLASRTTVPTRTFGIMQMAQSIASGLLFAAAAATIPRFGLGGIFALVCIATALALAPVTQTRRIDLASPGTARRSGFGMNPLLAAACLAIVLIFAANIGTVTSIGAFGQRADMSLAAISVLLAYSTAVAIVSSLLVALTAGRVPDALVLALSAIIASSGLIAIGMATTPPQLSVAVCAFIFGITLGIPGAVATASRLDDTGAAATAAQASLMIGIAFGPATAGALAGQTSLETMALTFAVVPVIGFAMVAVIAARRPLSSPVLAA